MHTRTFAVAAAIVAVTAVPYSAQPALDPTINDKIRQEEAQNSQVMKTLHYLADVHGPRVTGSPNHKAAARVGGEDDDELGHAERQARAVGVRLPRLGQRAPRRCTRSPRSRMRWSSRRSRGRRAPSGTVKAKAFNLVVPEGPLANPDAARRRRAAAAADRARLGPTEAELTAYLDSIKGKVAGAAVLVGKPVVRARSTSTPPRRTADRRTGALPLRRRRGQRSGVREPGTWRTRRRRRRRRARAAAAERSPDARRRSTSASTRSSSRTRPRSASTTPAAPHGQIIAFDNREPRHHQGRPDRRDAQRGLRPHRAHPRRRHAGASSRRRSSTSGTPRARPPTTPSRKSPARDKKDEVVMAGGHLDSWHSATGATDNAIGCAIMMEAARILKALNVQPRRTIRIALWSGEEQGLLGSHGLREGALRFRGRTEAGVREVQRLPEHRHRHRPPARRVGIRSAGNGGGRCARSSRRSRT